MSARALLLRAEARYYTGDVAGALEDINTTRTRSGNLPALLATDIATEEAFLDQLLYERKWSLLFEGHRWVDLRRFGRLNATYVPVDLRSHIILPQIVIPQAEASRDRSRRPPRCAVPAAADRGVA